jgi:hypothetical protein
MSSTADMIRTHPDHREADEQTFSRAIDELLACAQACTTCADACLAEEHVEALVTCIRLNLGCADLCTAAARFFSRRFDRAAADSLLEACIVACQTCAGECQVHAAHHDHCRVCAEACRRCADACAELRTALQQFSSDLS